MQLHRSFVFLLGFVLTVACGGGGHSAPVTPSGPGASAPSVAPSAKGSGSSVPAAASATIAIGPGYSDVGPHQLVRTSANVLYAIAPTCSQYPACPGGTLPAYMATNPGTPSGFVQVDAADAPQPQSANDAIGSSAIAIDSNDLIWVAWTQRVNNGSAFITTFNTHSNTWGTPAQLEITNFQFGQGDEGIALALDASGTPHVVWDFTDSTGVTHLHYAHGLSGGGFTTPLQVDDYPLAAMHGVIHPAVAFAPDGSFVAAWLDGFGPYLPNGTIHVRTRDPAGNWGSSSEIPDVAMTTIDNGPSILITGDGVRHVAFVNGSDTIRYWYGPDGINWHGDQQPATQQSHDPSLGPDGAGGIYIYGHGTPEPNIYGTGVNLYRFHKSAGATSWSPFTLWVSGTYDCSVSTRWAQFFQSFPATTDALYWNPNGGMASALFVGEN